MLKQWIRNRNVSRLAVNHSDASSLNPASTPEVDTLLDTAEKCYHAWVSHFEADSYKDEKAGAAISAFNFHWAAWGDIQRPTPLIKYDRLEGIKSHYQFRVEAEGKLRMRQRSCWCSSCFAAATSPLGAELQTVGCKRAGDPLYAWRYGSCSPLELAAPAAVTDVPISHGAPADTEAQGEAAQKKRKKAGSEPSKEDGALQKKPAEEPVVVAVSRAGRKIIPKRR
jgi:hypothetical protein